MSSHTDTNHKEIYLTNEAGEICWCEDQIDSEDVKYIRADIVAQELQKAREESENLKHLCYWLASLYQVNFEEFQLMPDSPKWKQKAYMNFATVQGTINRMFVEKLSKNKPDKEKLDKAVKSLSHQSKEEA